MLLHEPNIRKIFVIIEKKYDQYRFLLINKKLNISCFINNVNTTLSTIFSDIYVRFY